MAPEEKNLKWNPKAELDLCVAVLLGSQDGERVRYNWAKVTSIMQSLDYGFTKDAMTQHFSKSIMKDFKARSEAASSDAPDSAAAAADTEDADQPPQTPKPEKPKKAATPRKKGTATPVKDGTASAKRRRGKKAAEDGGEADGGSAKKTKVEDEGETPTKVKGEAAADAEDKTDGEERGGDVKMEAAAAA